MAITVFALVALHQFADFIGAKYLGPVVAGIVAILAISLLAISCAFALLRAHANVLSELDAAIQSKDKLNEEAARLVDTLNHSLGEFEQQNQQLRLIAKFNQRVHACESEQQILDLVPELLSSILLSEQGVLYCPTPEGELRRTVQWPQSATSEEIVRPQRCQALQKGIRLEGEFASCYGCNLTHPTRVACVPLRCGSRLEGLLQLTCRQADNSFAPNGDFVVRMVADQLSLALTNARSKRNLGDMVVRDALTGAFNRRYMLDALKSEIARSARAKSPLALLMLDLDHFKQLNDTMGHAVGDAVLKELGKLLMANVRSSDIVCRYGGEEFLIALPDTSAVLAKARADVLRRHVHGLSKIVKHHRLISASIGIAAMPEHGTDLKTLMRVADDALYDAKRSGRDRALIAPQTRLNSAYKASWIPSEPTPFEPARRMHVTRYKSAQFRREK